MNLCLFDLDHTLLPIDSDHAWGEFLIAIGWVDAEAHRRANDGFYADYQRGQLDMNAYVRFTTGPLREHGVEEGEAVRQRYIDEVIRPAVRPAAVELVEKHRAMGDRLALVTATHEFVTEPIARLFGIDTLIATKLVRGPGRTITGSIDGVPNYREGKVTRVTEWLRSEGLSWEDAERVTVYSDSPNDLPLLERATEPVATNPSADLLAVARERGWRILNLFT